MWEDSCRSGGGPRLARVLGWDSEIGGVRGRRYTRMQAISLVVLVYGIWNEPLSRTFATHSAWGRPEL
jgi:hypothetical protein